MSMNRARTPDVEHKRAAFLLSLEAGTSPLLRQPLLADVAPAAVRDVFADRVFEPFRTADLQPLEIVPPDQWRAMLDALERSRQTVVVGDDETARRVEAGIEHDLAMLGEYGAGYLRPRVMVNPMCPPGAVYVIGGGALAGGAALPDDLTLIDDREDDQHVDDRT